LKEEHDSFRTRLKDKSSDSEFDHLKGEFDVIKKEMNKKEKELELVTEERDQAKEQLDCLKVKYDASTADVEKKMEEIRRTLSSQTELGKHTVGVETHEGRPGKR